MKKMTLYLIIVLVLVGMLSVGGTYAYFRAVTNSAVNADNAEAYEFEVIYSGGEAIQGDLNMSVDKTGGESRVVTIRMGEGSALPKASLYMDISDIATNTLMDSSPWQKALKWEVIGTKNGSTVYTDSGDFRECSINGNTLCTNNQKLYIVKNYQLDYVDTEFTIWFWVDAEIADNGIIVAYIKGNIAATTEQYTGQISG